MKKLSIIASIILAVTAIAGLVLMFMDHMTLGSALCFGSALLSSLICLRNQLTKKEQ